MHSKIAQEPLSKYFDKDITTKLKIKFKRIFKNTLRKIIEISFSHKDNISYEKENNELKATKKEMIKKRFTIFNDEMKLNLKLQ